MQWANERLNAITGWLHWDAMTGWSHWLEFGIIVEARHQVDNFGEARTGNYNVLDFVQFGSSLFLGQAAWQLHKSCGFYATTKHQRIGASSLPYWSRQLFKFEIAVALMSIFGSKRRLRGTQSELCSG